MVHQPQEQVAEVENQVMVEPVDQEVVDLLLQELQHLEELELQTLAVVVEVVLLLKQIQVLEQAVQA